VHVTSADDYEERQRWRKEERRRDNIYIMYIIFIEHHEDGGGGLGGLGAARKLLTAPLQSLCKKYKGREKERTCINFF
jgi:hypothetical protein